MGDSLPGLSDLEKPKKLVQGLPSWNRADGEEQTRERTLLALTTHSLPATPLDGAAEGRYKTAMAKATCRPHSSPPRLRRPRAPIFIARIFGQAILRDDTHLLRQCRCATVENIDGTRLLTLSTPQRLTSATFTRNSSQMSTLGTRDGELLTKAPSCALGRTSMA